MIEVYADGGCNPMSGQGGWAAVVVDAGKKQVVSGAVKGATANRMEITAATEGLAQTPPGAESIVYTDSQYVFGCMTKHWQRRANRDLWARLDEVAAARKVGWEWIDQTAGNPYHREAHDLATAKATGADVVVVQPPTTRSVEPQPELTHLDAEGRPRMVDISAKSDTAREALARGVVRMSQATFERVQKGGMPKGDVLSVARLAGIMAAKQTPHLIPLCHPILIGTVEVDFDFDSARSAINIAARVKSLGKTGVEMEALTAVAVAALTIYDMCKAIDKGIRIENVRLARKSGGKSGDITLE